MSSFRALVLALAVIACAAGCRSTGGTIGGLVPAPKATKGTLSDGRYTAQDKSFSVAVPFPPGSPGHSVMAIVEKGDARESLVVFSSSAHPAEVYRVATFADVKPAGRLPEASLAACRKELETSSRAPLRAEKATPALIDGVLATSHRFSQTIPERTVDGHKHPGFVAIHVTHFLQRSTRAAFISVHRMQEGTMAHTTGNEARVMAFLKSFRLR
jgi:hypothetical protein